MNTTSQYDESCYWAIASVLADAQKGDPDAQCAVGERHWFGDLIQQDLSRAVQWYQLAAQNGHAYAQCCLAYAYATGEGIRQDPSQAAHWYSMAARHNDLRALRSLATCYAQGFGVKRDLRKAFAILSKALTQAAGTPLNGVGFDRP